MVDKQVGRLPGIRPVGRSGVLRPRCQLVEQVADKDRLAGSRRALDDDQLAKGAGFQVLVGDLGKRVEYLSLGLRLLFRKLMERRGLEQGGVLYDLLRREQSWHTLAQHTPSKREDRIELGTRIVLPLGVLPAVVQFLDRFGPRQVMHHAVLKVQRKRLVEVRVSNHKLTDDGRVGLNLFLEIRPVITAFGVDANMLVGADNDVVCLPDVCVEAARTAVLVAIDHVNRGVIKQVSVCALLALFTKAVAHALMVA